MSQKKGPIYEFEGFDLIPSEGLLVRDGKPVSLQPKAFATLVFLVEHHGHLVEKRALIEGVWEDSFVEEAAISRCVWQIRNALGVGSKDQKFIQTVPKRGYRFVATVRTTNGNEKPTLVEVNGSDLQTAPTNGQVLPISRSGTHSVAALTVAAERMRDTVLPFPAHGGSNGQEAQKPFRPVVVPRLRQASYSYALGSLIAAVAIIAAVGVYLLNRTRQPLAGSESVKLAVLPLTPVNPGERETAMEFAVAESLILKISETKSLNVKRLYAVRKFIDRDQDPIEAGRDLGVDYVLASNYQIADGRIRVTSHLMNVHTGEAERTFKSETDAGNLFTVQDAVSNEIGNALFAAFGKPSDSYTARRGTENEEAYSLYHEALYLVEKNTKDDSFRAFEMLNTATEFDSNFAAAWAFKAQAYCQYGHQGGGNPRELFTAAEPMLERALEIDQNNSVAYMVRGTIQRDYHWNLQQAYKDLDRSIQLDPNSSHAHQILAGIYHRDGRFKEAVEEQKIAIDLFPTNIWHKWFLADFLLAAGRVDEGLQQLQRITEIDPTFRLAYSSLWRFYVTKGDTAKAYEYLIKIKQVSGEPQSELDRFRGIYETSGSNGVLRAELDLMKSKDQKGKYSAVKIYMAQLAAQLGQNDAAFEYLEEAFQFRLIGLSYLKVDPLLAPVRGDARYKALLARTGL